MAINEMWECFLWDWSTLSLDIVLVSIISYTDIRPNRITNTVQNIQKKIIIMMKKRWSFYHNRQLMDFVYLFSDSDYGKYFIGQPYLIFFYENGPYNMRNSISYRNVF